MSGLVRPLGESPSLLGNESENGEAATLLVTGGGDLNDEGGGDDFFDFLGGCDRGGTGN